ncbi:uncharacterized protein [Henckelia pumila]|uniref:uncharacterized protein n=1 Tax=Henckelia pumila TaxID=405737 RepID=UPI003C6DCFE1
MSSDPKKDMVTKAIAKGVCFVLRKPVSSEGLKNVWQHVYLYKKRLQNIRNKNENINSTNADLLEIRCQVSNLSKENKRVEIARRSTLIEPKSKQVRESDHIHNDIEKMPLLKENDKQELKRKRTSEATSISDKETSSKVKPFEGKGKEIKTEEGTLEENYNLRRYPDLRLKFEEVINTPDKKGLCIEAERLVHMTRAPKIEEVNDQFEGKLISFQTRSDVGNEASRVGEKSANCHPGIPSISETKHSRPDSHKQLGQSLEKDANHEVTDSGQVYMKLTNGFQETNIKKEKNLSEDYSPEQFKLPLVPTGKKKKPNQPQSTSDMAVEVVQIKKENVKFNVEPTASDRIGSYSGGNSPPMEKELKL